MRALVVLLALPALALHAQWLKHPTPGIPRLANGQPDLAAPAPRTSGKKPDFSGIWELQHPPCPASGCADYAGGPEFGNLGARITGGLPYLPPAAKLVKERSGQLGRDDPVAFCRPPGAVRLWTFPPPRKIVQLPNEVIILSERDVTFRQIFTDGRALPSDPSPNWNGYSAGKWEGDTLVVQTNGLRDGTWLDRNGSPLSAGAKMTERIRRPNFGILEIDLTIDDPENYTRPWTVRLTQNILVDTELLDYHCMDNEKDAAHAVGK
jgi:hypothetical protein